LTLRPTGTGIGLLAVGFLAVAGCEAPISQAPVPIPDTAEMEAQVEKRFRETRAAVVADPTSADAWGRFGMVLHAHELWDEAAAAYRQAEALGGNDERWPYFLGDVLSVTGTELDDSADAFRRAMALRSDYAPAHMRLGKVLLAAGEENQAAAELERALELAPGLQPAQVSLAQIRLAQGELEEATRRLESVLEVSPRHGQALSTLGQAYMRLGRRDEARAIAVRARSAAIYNLYSDPLMGQVVSEGVSSVLVWERAKGFFDDGNFEQAALGLQRVVAVQPDNSEAHHQLAVAYGNVGDVDRSRYHLERTLALAPEQVEARMQLAVALLDKQEPAAAAEQLARVLELAPGDPDAPWLLAQARASSGDLAGGLATFESAAGSRAPTPAWAHVEWGKALAQGGNAEEAFEHFQTALADDPDSAEALFYSGLLLEGLGRTEEAVSYYCKSMDSKPNPPTVVRLQILGRSCP